MGKLDQRICELVQKINAIPDNLKVLLQLRNEVAEVKSILGSIAFPLKEMRELSSHFKECIRVTAQPVINKVEHHHHVPKIIILSIGLLLGLITSIVGWYLTNKNNLLRDTKYRFLKLKKNEFLQQLLYVTDSLYANQSDMREIVNYQEDSILDRFKQIQEIESKGKRSK